MIGEYFDVEARTRILGYQSAVGAAGAMLIGQAAGLVATFGGWRAPFALYLVAIPVVGIVAYAVPSNRSTARRSLRAASESKEKSASILRLLPLLPLLALVVLLFIGSYMSNIHVSFLLDDDGVSTPALRSLPLSVSALMVAVGSACYGSVRLRLGDRWTLRLCGALLGIGVITMGIAPTGEVVALGCGIAGFGTGIANPQVNNMLISASDPSIRGRAIGFGYTARYLGNFLNPWIVRPIAFAAGMHNAFIIVGAMFVAGVLLDTATRRRRALAS
jgi:MFS family permease